MEPRQAVTFRPGAQPLVSAPFLGGVGCLGGGGGGWGEGLGFGLGVCVCVAEQMDLPAHVVLPFNVHI